MSNARRSCLTASFFLFFLKLKLSLESDEVSLKDLVSLDVVVEVDLAREVEDFVEDEDVPPPDLSKRFIAEGQCERAGV